MTHEPRARALLVALASLSAALFAVSVAGRLAFPYELTLVEALQPLMTERALSGLPLYVPPTLDFIGPIYPPLLFLLDAALARVFGLSLPVLRAVSVLSTLGAVAIVYVVLRRQQAPQWVAAVCSAMVLAAHTRLGESLDLARVDAPAMLLTVLGLAAAERAAESDGAEWRWTALAAAALAAAALTKQTALAAAAGACLALLGTGRVRGAIRLGALVVVLLTTAGVALHATTDGWSTFYILTLPSQQPIVFRDLLLSIGRLIVFFPAALVASIAAIGWLARGREGWREISVWEAALVPGVLGALVANARMGGADNVWTSVVPLAAIAIGRQWAGPHRALVPRAVTVCAVALQVIVLPHRPMAEIPSSADRQVHRQLVEDLERQAGPLLNPLFPYESRLAGGPAQPLLTQIADFGVETPLRIQLAAAIAGRRYAAVIAPEAGHAVFAGLETAYPRRETWTMRAPAFDGTLQLRTR